MTDKTGTLTKNQMILKALSISGNVYGQKNNFWEELAEDMEVIF